jgi:hypothetical protein
MALLTASFMVPMARLPFINPSPGHKTMHARQAQGKDGPPQAPARKELTLREPALKEPALKEPAGIAPDSRIWARTRGLPEGPTGL